MHSTLWRRNNVMRICVAGSEILEILAHFHSGPTRGHHSASITGRKVYESGFYWPSIFKDAKDYVMRCNACQQSGNISSEREILQNNIRVSAAKNRFMELNELMELRDEAYENNQIYKERTKKWHDSRLRGDKDFKAGDKAAGHFVVARGGAPSQPDTTRCGCGGCHAVRPPPRGGVWRRTTLRYHLGLRHHSPTPQGAAVVAVPSSDRHHDGGKIRRFWEDLGVFRGGVNHGCGQPMAEDNALAGLGASISLMPYTMYKKLGLGERRATRISLELADTSIKYPRGIIENVLITMDKFVLPIDFVILDIPEDSRVTIILGRPFLATAQAMINVFNKKITLRVGDEEVVFDVDQSIRRPTTEDDECYGIDDLDDTINEEAQELLANEEHDSFLSKGLEKSIDQSDLECCESASSDGNNEFDPENSIRCIDYANTSYLVMQGTTKCEDVKNSSWVSPIHVVPKKGGMTVVLNDNNELIPSRIVTGWRVCIDYHKLNDATQKDHFPLPFIDQMLDCFCGNEYYCFLDGFSGFFQIPIALEDQEKTTFTCPYGTFAYRRMPFGLCNAPATFQRCMTAIFHDMVEDFMEVFMDDFSVFGNSFDCCLANLDRILTRYEETNLVLNWEKCHFMLLMKDAKFDCSDDCKKAFNILKEKLTTAPIIISPDWNVPFELMCDTGDFAVGAVLGQQIFRKFKSIYYASKTLNNAQEHYTTIEKKTSRSWAENLAANHLSRLENLDLGTFTKEEITDEFPDEHLMILKAKLNNNEPWYADYDEPYAFKLCPNNVMRICVAGSEILEILAHCHSGPTGGHHSASITRRKVYESGFYWPSIFKDAKDYVMRCNACQRSGNISSRSEIPQNNIQWYGPNVVKTVHPYGIVEIINKNRINFKVNGQRLKKYHNGLINEEEKEVVELDDDTT
ncbi:reverse transcriptase domain-containing protein [Tanacetum coccineum]